MRQERSKKTKMKREGRGNERGRENRETEKEREKERVQYKIINMCKGERESRKKGLQKKVYKLP